MPDFVGIGKRHLLPPSVGTRQYLFLFATFFDQLFQVGLSTYCLFYLSVAAMSVVGNKSDLEDSRQVPRDRREVLLIHLVQCSLKLQHQIILVLKS